MDIKAIGITEDIQKISRKAVVDGIIRPRLQEICKFVGKEIKKSGFASATPSGLVICGGGAQTMGLLDQAKYVIGFPARIGKISRLSGMVDEVDSPQFATAAGLILYGVAQSQRGEYRLPVLASNLPIKGVLQKGVNWVKSLLP